MEKTFRRMQFVVRPMSHLCAVVVAPPAAVARNEIDLGCGWCLVFTSN